MASKPLSSVLDMPVAPRRPTVDEAVRDVFGLEPGREDRLALLPRYSRQDGWVAPQTLYDLARFVVAPGVAAQGGYVTEEEALNVAMNLMGANVAAGTLNPVEGGAVAGMGARKGRGLVQAGSREAAIKALSDGKPVYVAHELDDVPFRVTDVQMLETYSPDRMLIGADASPSAKPKGGKKPPSNLTQIPSLRGLPVDEAVKIGAKEPHLIKSGDRSEGFYLGGPREIGGKRGITNQRKAFDAYVGADPRGADWYDRYRAGVNEVTGGNVTDNLWMSNQEGQWSAGVGPDSELQFALRENNASLMGMPTKSARPAQHEAHLRAIAANDPSLYQLGDKTGEYAGLVNPDRPGPAGATGVNDFRHARNWRYTEPDGSPQKNGLTQAQHTFMDYETALAVKRANDTGLGGRTDWTGEKLQAAPWVRQKALDVMKDRNLVAKYEGMGNPPEEAFRLAYEEAFDYANKSITEFFPKHTMNATYEAQPGGSTGHLPLASLAEIASRDAYALDPRSAWNTAPGGRDAIYGGLRLGDTGVATRVRESLPMQGYYIGEDGVVQQNLGGVARPLVSFVNDPELGKVVGPADRAMVDAAETFRAALDAQDAGAAHIAYLGQAPGQSNSFSIPHNGPMGRAQMASLAEIGRKYGLPDVSDTGKGVTLTRFDPIPDARKPKQTHEIVDALGEGGFHGPMRSKVDSVYARLVEEWKAGEGSGAVTRKVLDKINVTPEARAAFDNNPYLAERAIARIERDKDAATKWGATREDLTTFRRIIGDGPGWVGRLEVALKNGVALPAVAGAVLLEVYRQSGEEPPAG